MIRLLRRPRRAYFTRRQLVILARGGAVAATVAPDPVERVLDRQHEAEVLATPRTRSEGVVWFQVAANGGRGGGTLIEVVEETPA